FGTRGAGQFISALRSGKLNFDDLAASAGLSGDTILDVADDTNDWRESLTLLKNRALLAIEPVAMRVFDLLGKAAKGATVFITALTGGSELNEFDGALRVINNLGIKAREVFQAFAGFLTGT